MNIPQLVFVASLSLTCASTPSNAETWKVTSLDWEPYSGALLDGHGHSVVRLRELLKKLDIELVIEFYPWQRSQEKAATAEYVGYFPAWPEEVTEGFVASPPIDWSSVNIMKQTGSDVNFDSIDELFQKYRVGIVSTYAYPKVINDAMEKYPNQVDKARNEVLLMRKLSRGRHEVAITDPAVMHYVARQEGISNIESVETVVRKELVIAFSDSNDNQERIKLLKELLSNND